MVDLPDQRNDEFHKAEICWNEIWRRPICVWIAETRSGMRTLIFRRCQYWDARDSTTKIDGSMPRQDMTRVVSTGGRRAVNLNLSTQDR